MTAAKKPQATATAAKKPQATATAVKPGAEEEEKPGLKSGDEIKVKNISGKTLNLVNGPIEKDKVGTATVAEYSNFHKFLEKV